MMTWPKILKKNKHACIKAIETAKRMNLIIIREIDWAADKEKSNEKRRETRNNDNWLCNCML
jgi:hypothetical protein